MSDISVGTFIARLDKWVRSVKPVKRASPSNRKPAAKAAGKSAPATTAIHSYVGCGSGRGGIGCEGSKFRF